MKFWCGESISLLGSQITVLALPLTAAVILQASPEQMGILGAAAFLPFLLVGLFAGVWVDRIRRKPVLMVANIGRAILLSTIPFAALWHVLRIEYLYVVAFLFGILTLFFDVAYQSYLPSLVGRNNLVEGNSKLEVSRSITRIAGPSVAGVLVQLLTAPLAIALDALSFVVSVVFLWRIRTSEPPPASGEQRHILDEIGEGLQAVLRNPTLRTIAACTTTSNLFATIAETVFILYATQHLNLDAVALGLVFGIASFGGLVGGLYASQTVGRYGLGTTLIGGILLAGVGHLFIALASGSWLVAVPLIIVGQFLSAVGSTIYNVNQVSLRLTITPHRLLGRINASMRFIVLGIIPVGSLIGGVFGGSIGLRGTLVVGAFGMLFAPLWIYFSPVRELKEQPAPLEEGT